jgi:hypothetical protein
MKKKNLCPASIQADKMGFFVKDVHNLATSMANANFANIAHL